MQDYTAMKPEIFNTSEEALQATTEALHTLLADHGDKPFHIALSGGETAQLLFKIWARDYREKIPWDKMRFYWVDERCVPPDDAQSNYKYAEELLFQPLEIPSSHVHRIFGEEEPETEAQRYSEVVRWELPGYCALPRFDCTVLGIGSGGHTASIFQETASLLKDTRCYAVSRHPETGQKRITMTGSLILKSRRILIPVVGFAKTDLLREVIRGISKSSYPASYILGHASAATLFTNCQLDEITKESFSYR